jgi:hypothetical protein
VIDLAYPRQADIQKSKNKAEEGSMMRDFVDGTAYNNEQGNRARKLFAAVVLAALDDAIADDKKYGNGPDQIARWARSRDGREVLTCAGIDPNERVVQGLMDFVSKGVRTSVALSREESERRHAAEEEAARAA